MDCHPGPIKHQNANSLLWEELGLKPRRHQWNTPQGHEFIGNLPQP